MPKKLPGIDLQFAVTDDEGNVETGFVRAMPKSMPFKAMRAIQKAIARMEKASQEPEPEAKPNG